MSTQTQFKEQAHQLIDQVPNEADWPTLLHDVQEAADRAMGVLAEELNPNSPLRQSLARGLKELDAGEGVTDEALTQALRTRT